MLFHLLFFSSLRVVKCSYSVFCEFDEGLVCTGTFSSDICELHVALHSTDVFCKGFHLLCVSSTYLNQWLGVVPVKELRALLSTSSVWTLAIVRDTAVFQFVKTFIVLEIGFSDAEVKCMVWAGVGSVG